MKNSFENKLKKAGFPIKEKLFSGGNLHHFPVGEKKNGGLYLYTTNPEFGIFATWLTPTIQVHNAENFAFLENSEKLRIYALFQEVLKWHREIKLLDDKEYDIPLEFLKPSPSQHRKHFDEIALAELKASIASIGLLNAITIKHNTDGRLYIPAGNRRYRAIQQLGKKTIKAKYKETGSSSEIALAENYIRVNLHPIEVAEALLQLKNDRGYTNREVGKIIYKSAQTVSEILSINYIPESDKEKLRRDPNISQTKLIKISREVRKKKRVVDPLEKMTKKTRRFHNDLKKLELEIVDGWQEQLGVEIYKLTLTLLKVIRC